MGRRKNGRSNDHLEAIRRELSALPAKAMPATISPMLATLVPEAFDSNEWIFEEKLDGYRGIAFIKNGDVRLRSRENTDYGQRYPGIIEALKAWNEDAVLDGEIVILDDEGKPDFEALERNVQKSNVYYYVFDLLWYDGRDTMHLPLTLRKQMLKNIIPVSGIVRYCEHTETHGKELFKKIADDGREGIVAKKKDSTYAPGKRSIYWKKITARKVHQFVLGGWVESEKGPSVKSLLFGYYDNDKMLYYLHCGHGWSAKHLPGMLDAFSQIASKHSPFANKVDYPGRLHWLQPLLVADIRITHISKQTGKIRHSHPVILERWLYDVDPKTVTVDTIPWLTKNR